MEPKKDLTEEYRQNAIKRLDRIAAQLIKEYDSKAFQRFPAGRGYVSAAAMAVTTARRKLEQGQ